MTKASAAKVERTAGTPATDIALGSGLHAATIELASKGRYRVRTSAGQRARDARERRRSGPSPKSAARRGASCWRRTRRRAS